MCFRGQFQKERFRTLTCHKRTSPQFHSGGGLRVGHQLLRSLRDRCSPVWLRHDTGDLPVRIRLGFSEVQEVKSACCVALELGCTNSVDMCRRFPVDIKMGGCITYPPTPLPQPPHRVWEYQKREETLLYGILKQCSRQHASSQKSMSAKSVFHLRPVMYLDWVCCVELDSSQTLGSNILKNGCPFYETYYG